MRDKVKRTKQRLLAGVLIALTVLGVSAGFARANHVRIDINVDPQHSVPPAPTTSLPAAVPPQTLQADEIKAHQVRAQTIYANKIEADEVQGLIHHTRGVKISNTRGEIRAPEVSASVIYADTITANSVVAEAVYVRDLRRK